MQSSADRSEAGRTQLGAELFVLEEGTYAGQVFWNFHDEGLFHIEMMGEYAEDELGSRKSKKALIEAMPFFKAKSRVSLRDAFAALEIVPTEEPRVVLDALQPLEKKTA